jgi:Nucleoside diphosphate kinase
MKSFVVLVLAVLTASTLAFTSTSRKNNVRTPLFMSTERTYIMVKPDGVQRGLVGNIVSRFETKGYKLVAMKTRMATKEILDEHYKDLVKKPFFPKLREYLLSGPVVSMCWEGKEAGTYMVLENSCHEQALLA